MEVPGYGDAMAAPRPLNGLTYKPSPDPNNKGGVPWYQGPAPVVTSATTFGQWWMDSTYTNNAHVVGNLELAALAGSTSLYRFCSQPHSVCRGLYPFHITL